MDPFRLDLVRAWAREIITGQLSAIEGARRISQQGLTVFVDLVSEWQADEAHREECERQILDQAALLLADTS